jgi:uncharacterized cupredoxin-like copper-binding protein
MRQLGSALSILLLGAVLVGCGIGTASAAGLTSTPSPSSQLSPADWSRAETLSLTLSDFHFTPEKLELRQGTPYRLHLVNASTSAHTFASEAFFRAIAVRPPAQATGALVPVALRDVELGPEEQKDVNFVAVTPGSYDFECSKFLHSMFGMTGKIIVH